jgi:hypothetical protein
MMDWGSARHHKREVVRVPARCRRPFCPGEVRATHAGQCNGITLVLGCEWHMRVWARDGRVVPPGGRLVNYLGGKR